MCRGVAVPEAVGAGLLCPRQFVGRLTELATQIKIKIKSGLGYRSASELRS